jgi:uncharacterized membrane protein
MPPLCTIGFGLGSGANMRIMGGAGLLFLTNLVAIVASAFLVFLLTGMNAPEVRSEMEHSRKGELFAERLSRGPFSRLLFNSGQLRWRILMLVVLLAAIAVPLRTAFVQVAGEAVTRGAVQVVVKRLLPPGALVSQQVEVGRDSVAVRLISTRAVSDEKLHEAEREIERRSGRRAELTVATIASQSELAELMQRRSVPAQPAPVIKPETLEDIHHNVITRIKPIIEDIWPAEAPLQGFDISFGPTGIVLNVQYSSDRELGKVPQEMIAHQLQEKLGTTDLSLVVKRIPPPRKRVRETREKAR